MTYRPTLLLTAFAALLAATASHAQVMDEGLFTYNVDNDRFLEPLALGDERARFGETVVGDMLNDDDAFDYQSPYYRTQGGYHYMTPPRLRGDLDDRYRHQTLMTATPTVPAQPMAETWGVDTTAIDAGERRYQSPRYRTQGGYHYMTPPRLRGENSDSYWQTDFSRYDTYGYDDADDDNVVEADMGGTVTGG